MNPVDVGSHCEMISSHFTASAFVTTWCRLVSQGVILSPLRLIATQPTTGNFLVDLRGNGCCGGAQLWIGVRAGPCRPQMRTQEGRLSRTATPKPPNLSRLLLAPNSGATATPGGRNPQLRRSLESGRPRGLKSGEKITAHRSLNCAADCSEHSKY